MMLSVAQTVTASNKSKIGEQQLKRTYTKAVMASSESQMNTNYPCNI